MVRANAASWIWYIECGEVVDSVVEKRFDEFEATRELQVECADGEKRDLWHFYHIGLLDFMCRDLRFIQQPYTFYFNIGDGLIQRFNGFIPPPFVSVPSPAPARFTRLAS